MPEKPKKAQKFKGSINESYSKNQLNVILKNVDDGISVQDSTGKLIYANEAAVKLIGFTSPKELLSTPNKEIIKRFQIMDEYGKPLSISSFPGRLALKGKISPETIVRFKIIKTGEERWSRVKATPVFGKNKKVQLAINVFQDITELKRGEAILKKRIKMRAAVAELGEEALKGLAIPKLYKKAVNLVCETLNTEFCKILELLPDGKNFLLRESIGWKEGIVGKTKIPANPKTSQAGYTLVSGKPVIVHDLTKEKRFTGLKLHLDFKIKSGISVVILGRDKPYGILCAHNKTKRVFTDDDVNFMTLIANVLSAAIDRKRAELAVQKSERQFKSIFNTALDAVIITDDERRLTDINPSAAHLLGLPKELIIGRKIENFTIAPSLKTIQELWKKFLEKGEQIGEFQILRPDGTTREVEYSSSANFQPRFHLSVLRDITERKEEERRRENFLGIASHEFKTPLASIKAFAQILQNSLQQQHGDDKPNMYLQKIDQQVNKLTTLINDLLDVTKIRSGRLELSQEVFSFDNIVKEAISGLQDVVESHRIIKKGQTKKSIMADKIRVNQVITNLISNAVKYSPGAGKVIVSLSTNKDEVMLKVQDFGIGITPQDQRRIFEPFYRVSTTDTGKFSSFGFGLYIASQIIKLHGGQIGVESKKGKGSIFFFKLPTKKIKIKKEISTHGKGLKYSQPRFL